MRLPTPRNTPPPLSCVDQDTLGTLQGRRIPLGIGRVAFLRLFALTTSVRAPEIRGQTDNGMGNRARQQFYAVVHS